MAREFTEAELEAYLDEALSPAEMSDVEALLRNQTDLVNRLKAILGRRDAGIHSLGEIWRRHRVSCPERETLGSFLLGVLDSAEQAYVKFHLESIGCRYCNANLEDLKDRQREAQSSVQDRRRRYFHSSAGYLERDD